MKKYIQIQSKYPYDLTLFLATLLDVAEDMGIQVDAWNDEKR